MRRIALGALVALAIPGAAVAAEPTKKDRQNAAAACRAEREAMGAENFRNTYGTNKRRSNAFGKCRSRQSRAEAKTRAAAKSSCREERRADRQAFEAKYGSNRNRRNAMGRCVSAQQRAERSEAIEARVNAAKACRAERDADRDAFREKYGTNKRKRNAFGKCVSARAKQQRERSVTREP